MREMITRIQKAGNVLMSDRLRMVIAKSHEDKNEAEGVERGGADKGNSEGEGAAQGDENDYLLAKPWLLEAHDSDSSTVVQRTGQDRSPTGPLRVDNPPYTQHLGGDNVNKDEGGGLSKDVNKDEGAGLDKNVNKGQGEGGVDAQVQDHGFNTNEEVGADQ